MSDIEKMEVLLGNFSYMALKELTGVIEADLESNSLQRGNSQAGENLGHS